MIAKRVSVTQDDYFIYFIREPAIWRPVISLYPAQEAFIEKAFKDMEKAQDIIEEAIRIENANSGYRNCT